MLSKILEQVGFAVDLQILGPVAYGRKTFVGHLGQPPEQQPWDIALGTWLDVIHFPPFQVYTWFALDSPGDWLLEQPELRHLYEQVLGTVDREHQQGLIRQMERHAHDQAYFLFLYNPIQLYAANKAVQFVPYVNMLNLAETLVTTQHWSVREVLKGAVEGQVSGHK